MNAFVTAEHMHTLLDPDAMRQALHAIPVLADGTARLASIALDRLWVKPGRHVHASYRVTLETDAGATETIAAVGLLRRDQSASEMHRRALNVPAPTGPARCPGRWDVARSTALVDSFPMLVQLFPWDYRLATLPRALDLALMQATLAGVTLRSCTVAGYWPGVRCQIRYEREEQEGVLYGKVFADDAGATVGRNQKVIAHTAEQVGNITAARVHAYIPALKLLLTEPLEGEPLPGLLPHALGKNLMSQIATALATFHTLSVGGIERRFRPADDFAVVQSWVTFSGAVFPSLAPALASVQAALERRLPTDAATRPALVHRDFYDKQILIGPSTIGLLDLDTACLGDGEIDVGNFCAHLILRALQSRGAAKAFLPLQQEFVEAYRTHRPQTDMHRVAWYLASALLRLACIYALRPWWHALAPRLIEESSRTIGA